MPGKLRMQALALGIHQVCFFFSRPTYFFSAEALCGGEKCVEGAQGGAVRATFSSSKTRRKGAAQDPIAMPEGWGGRSVGRASDANFCVLCWATTRPWPMQSEHVEWEQEGGLRIDLTHMWNLRPAWFPESQAGWSNTLARDLGCSTDTCHDNRLALASSTSLTVAFRKAAQGSLGHRGGSGVRGKPSERWQRFTQRCHSSRGRVTRESGAAL